MGHLDMRSSYSRVAADYAERFVGELDYKPFDRALLDRVAETLRGRGPACDLGCGPGHVAAYLHDRGVEAVGCDLSDAMVAEAARRFPSISFRQGDMRDLDVPDGAWAGIVAFYCLIHIPPEELVPVLAELRRVLQPGGLLLVSFHIGSETIHLDEWWGQPVDLDFRFYEVEAMKAALTEADFELVEVHEREPYREEHPSRRGYIVARRAA